VGCRTIQIHPGVETLPPQVSPDFWANDFTEASEIVLREHAAGPVQPGTIRIPPRTSQADQRRGTVQSRVQHA
jgi:hypothetical protein